MKHYYMHMESQSEEPGIDGSLNGMVNVHIISSNNVGKENKIFMLF